MHISQTAVRCVLLALTFLFGLLEGVVFRQRDWACATWAVGTIALAIWIIYPGSAIRIATGIALIVVGFTLMGFYYKKGVSRR